MSQIIALPVRSKAAAIAQQIEMLASILEKGEALGLHAERMKDARNETALHLYRLRRVIHALEDQAKTLEHCGNDNHAVNDLHSQLLEFAQSLKRLYGSVANLVAESPPQRPDAHRD